MTLPRITIPRLSDHGSEIALLGILGVGVIFLLWRAIELKLVGSSPNGFDVAAFLLVLQRIVEAIQGRWTQRSVDRMGQQLGASLPPSDGPTGNPNDPLTVQQARKEPQS